MDLNFLLSSLNSDNSNKPDKDISEEINNYSIKSKKPKLITLNKLLDFKMSFLN